jgi:hypothetical protein
MDITRKRRPLPKPTEQKKPKLFTKLGETETTISAFEYYYLLGETRSYDKVAEKFKVNRLTIWRWAKKFDWRKRILDRNLAFSEKLQESTTTQLVGIHVEYGRMCNRMIREFMSFVEYERRERAAELRQ